MFDLPLETLYVWVGLGVVSATLFGIAAAVPAVPPPDATGAAETVDRVAASQYTGVGEHPLSNTEEIRVGSDTISLRGAGGISHADLGYGPATPAHEEGLRRVLLGEPPGFVFDSPSAFDARAERARGNRTWQRTDRLVVRRVTWEGIDVTLVG